MIDPLLGIDLVEGRFGATDARQLAALFQDAVDDDHIVLHVHGGLVPRRIAVATAAPWAEGIRRAGARPLVVIWNSGPIQTLAQNLDVIAADLFASRIAHHVLRRVGRALVGDPAGLPSAPVEDDPRQIGALAADLRSDEELSAQLARVLEPDPSALALPSLVSAAVVRELRASTDPAALAVPWLTLARLVLRVVVRVHRRRMREAPSRGSPPCYVYSSAAPIAA